MEDKDMEKIISRVRKLLAKAGNNSSDAEAQAALAKAQEYMVKYGVKIEDTNQERKVHYGRVDKSTKLWWKIALANIIADNFRCWAYCDPMSLLFAGMEEDVPVASELYMYAVDFIEYHAQKLRKKWRAAGEPTTGVMTSYCKGFLSQLKAKFDEQVEQNGWGLILVKEDALVKRIEEITGQCERQDIYVKDDPLIYEAYAEGCKDGKSFAKPSALIGDE